MACTSCGGSGSPSHSSGCSDPVGNYQLVNNGGCTECCSEMGMSNNCDDMLKAVDSVDNYICGQQSQVANVKLLIKKTMSKLTCVTRNVIRNLCCLNSKVDTIGNYLKTLQIQAPKQRYYRTSTTSPGIYQHGFNEDGHIEIFMDGSNSSWSGEKEGGTAVADQDYIVNINWCNDPTGITLGGGGATGATWVVTAYSTTSAGNIDRDKWSRHIQVMGGDWAIPANDTILVKKGEHVFLDIKAQNDGIVTGGTFRLHQIHAVWQPVSLNNNMPELPSC